MSGKWARLGGPVTINIDMHNLDRGGNAIRAIYPSVLQFNELSQFGRRNSNPRTADVSINHLCIEQTNFIFKNI